MQLALLPISLILFVSTSHYALVTSFSTQNVIVRQTFPVGSAAGNVQLKSHFIHRRSNTHLHMSKLEDDAEEKTSLDTILGTVGVTSQPIVWVSLYFVASTGRGLPEGPFGLLGAIEGLSYLAIVSLVLKRLVLKSKGSDLLEKAENLSLLTIGFSLLVLGNLIAQQGCIPNAKPLLDYSNFVKVCK